MPIEFTSELETGSNTIDSQHREWIKRYNDFIVSLRKGEGKNDLLKLFAFLEDYTHDHFAAEEALMTANRYAAFEGHKAMHEGFKKTLKEFKNNLDQEGPAVFLAVKATELIGDWLRNHILSVDKNMVAKIKSS
jgi:hemerythrin